MPAKVSVTERSGWRALVLSDDRLAVHVLPDKGADIVAFIDRPSATNLLFEAPWGLQPPGAPPRAGWMDEPFLANYEGGWQELLPNTNDRCIVDGIELPFHGDVATAAWTFHTEHGDRGEQLCLEVACESVPLRLRRRMRLIEPAGLELEERVRNVGERAVRFTWGHHCVLGPPLVAAGARMELAGGELSTPADPWEATHRLEPGQRGRWPLARLRSGALIDLQELPGQEAGSHDDVFIDALDAGWAQVLNPRLGIGFRLEWDPGVFGSLISWQALGGARAMPLAGSYAIGLEPWRFGGNLSAAVAASRELSLGPGESLDTTVVARLIKQS